MKGRSGPVLGNEKHCKVLQPYKMLPQSFLFFQTISTHGKLLNIHTEQHKKTHKKWQTMTETVVVPLLGKGHEKK